MRNFKRRKWSSHDPAVVNDIPVEDRLNSLEIHKTDDSPKIKTLGVLWEAINKWCLYLLCSTTRYGYENFDAGYLDNGNRLGRYPIGDLIARWNKWVSELQNFENM